MASQAKARSKPKAERKPKADRSAKGLSRTAVIEQALELIDREGLVALNFRRLAKELGVTPMAFYNHFANREDLLDAMLDYVVGGLHLRLDADLPWTEQVEAAFGDLHEALDRHPGATDLIVAHPEGDRLGELRDALMASVTASGIPKTEAEDLLRAIASYVVGFIVLARSRAPVKVRRGSPQAFDYGLEMLTAPMKEKANAA